MTYIKVLHTDVADERWLTAGSDAFALHVAATVWCDRQLTDGRIPKAIARRGALATIAPDETAAPIEALLEAGFWTDDGDAYVLVDYLEHAFPADQVKRTRDRWNQDKARRRQHAIGDHSLCKDPKYCPAVSKDVSTVDSTGGGSHLDQTRLDQTRPDRRSGSGSGAKAAGGSAGATPPRPGRGVKCPHGVMNGISLGQCPDDDCFDEWSNLQHCIIGNCHAEKNLGDDACNPGACWLRDEWPAQRGGAVAP